MRTKTRTIFGLYSGRDAPAERKAAIDEGLDGRCDEVDAAQLGEIDRQHDVEEVEPQRRELARIRLAKDLRWTAQSIRA